MSLKKSVDQDSQMEDLDPSDKVFEEKLKEIIKQLPEILLRALVVVLFIETTQELRSQRLSNTVESVFAGTRSGNALATPVLQTTPSKIVPLPVSTTEASKIPEVEYNFQVGQLVEINDESKIRGTISEIAYFNGVEGSKLSFLIVDFPDGSWGGFNPDQLKVITDTTTLSSP
jgi:hypothetical protein